MRGRRRKEAGKVSFHAAGSLRSSVPRGAPGAQSGCCRSPSDRWAADGSGGGRRPLSVVAINLHSRRHASRHPSPSETSEEFFAIIFNDGSLVEGVGEGWG